MNYWIQAVAYEAVEVLDQELLFANAETPA